MHNTIVALFLTHSVHCIYMYVRLKRSAVRFCARTELNFYCHGTQFCLLTKSALHIPFAISAAELKVKFYHLSDLPKSVNSGCADECVQYCSDSWFHLPVSKNSFKTSKFHLLNIYILLPFLTKLFRYLFQFYLITQHFKQQINQFMY